ESATQSTPDLGRIGMAWGVGFGEGAFVGLFGAAGASASAAGLPTGAISALEWGAGMQAAGTGALVLGQRPGPAIVGAGIGGIYSGVFAAAGEEEGGYLIGQVVDWSTSTLMEQDPFARPPDHSPSPADQVCR